MFKDKSHSYLHVFSIAIIALTLTGCTPFFAYSNKKFDPKKDSLPMQASFKIKNRGNDKVLMILALSGGGSRAAYFSSIVMLRLQEVFAKDIDLLKEVDAISAVSGGTLPAVYYSISKDPDSKQQSKSKKIWEGKKVKELMSRNFTTRWFGNWFWPHNIVRYWFTKFDRSDIMAETLGDNLFNASSWGADITFSELNPERPHLIINATNATDNISKEMPFGSVFTFTKEDFKTKINSDIYDYSIPKAVMASAAFPLVFNDATLCGKFNETNIEVECKGLYLHLFDGGNADNLGLQSIKRIFLENDLSKYKKIIVISIDASKKPKGVDSNLMDRRQNLLNYIIDTNLSESFDMFMEDRRQQLLREFETCKFDFDKDCEKGRLTKEYCADKNMINRKQEEIEKKLFFYHVAFENIEDTKIRNKVNNIPTNFSISDDEEDLKDSEKLEAGSNIFMPEDRGGSRILEVKKEFISNACWLERVANDLINERNESLKNIRDILLDKQQDSTAEDDPRCEDSKK